MGGLFLFRIPAFTIYRIGTSLVLALDKAHNKSIKLLSMPMGDLIEVIASYANAKGVRLSMSRLRLSDAPTPLSLGSLFFIPFLFPPEYSFFLPSTIRFTIVKRRYKKNSNHGSILHRHDKGGVPRSFFFLLLLLLLFPNSVHACSRVQGNSTKKKKKRTSSASFRPSALRSTLSISASPRS